MTRSQFFILAVGVVLVTAVVLLFAGVIPGLQKPETSTKITLQFWGTMDRQSAFEEVIGAFVQVHPNVTVTYRELPEETYEKDLVNALAAGKGPDVFMFHNTWLPKHYDKIVAAPQSAMTITDFRNLFPRVAEQDFAPSGTIYALPLYIDTLALLYNKDIFDNKAVALAPKTWSEVQADILKIRELTRGGNIKLAGAAIGGSAKSVHRASDLLSLLMLQTGVKMTDDSFTQATFSQKGEQALKFYTQFADPKNKYYTWNDTLPYSLDAFAQGSTAIIFNYYSNLRRVKEKNPFLRVGASEMPQTSTQTSRVDYPNYYGLAVSASSRAASTAWEFVKFVTADAAQSAKYLRAGKHPPALRSLINASLDNDEYGVFARQALTARSWPQIDNVAVDNLFSDMINATARGRLTAIQALQQAEAAMNDLMAKRR